MLTRWNDDWVAAWMSDPFRDLRSVRTLRRAVGVPDAARATLSDGGDALRLQLDLPGFAPEDVDVRLERSTLTVRAERRIDVPEGYVARRRERGSMQIERAFTLPCRVDAERTTAKLENGVLELTLPKVPDEQPRRIEVRITEGG